MTGSVIPKEILKGKSFGHSLMPHTPSFSCFFLARPAFAAWNRECRSQNPNLPNKLQVKRTCKRRVLISYNHPQDNRLFISSGSWVNLADSYLRFWTCSPSSRTYSELEIIYRYSFSWYTLTVETYLGKVSKIVINESLRVIICHWWKKALDKLSSAYKIYISCSPHFETFKTPITFQELTFQKRPQARWVWRLRGSTTYLSKVYTKTKLQFFSSVCTTFPFAIHHFSIDNKPCFHSVN